MSTRKSVSLEGMVGGGRGDSRVQEITQPAPAAPEPVLSGKTITMSVRIPVEKHTRLKTWCSSQRTTIQDFILNLIDEDEARRQGS
jgi:hypothetical protein